MPRLYLTALPNGQAQSADEGVRADVQTSGLIQQGGVASERIATDNVDVIVSGQFRLGQTIGQKVADELESLSESTYEGLPLFDPNSDDLGRNKGYYEVERVDASQAHPTNRDTFEYTVGLRFAGTKQTHWRAVSTSDESISTGLATGSSGLIGVVADEAKERWFDVGQGTEVATPVDSVETEFGRVDLFDPANSSYTDPTLLYEVNFDDDAPVDVRVWDDRNREKYFRVDDADSPTVSTSTTVSSATTVGGSTRAAQWTHAFHTAFEFDGDAIVDNGLIRLRFDERNNLLRPYRWSTRHGWALESLDHSNYRLFDADIERIGPADVQVFAEFENTSSGAIEAAVLSVQRGIDGVVVRQPDNGTIPGDLETMLTPIASDQTSDRQPAQKLLPRSEVK